jgi:hypothetical protein
LRFNEKEESVISRKDMEIFMYGKMQSMMIEKSYGCSGSTEVGNFSEGVGYFVVDGKISFGKVPEGLKYCKDCHCHYSGEKCPFC